MRSVLYSDPNCPFCFATEERLHALGLAPDAVPEWRGVQHAPHLPTPMLRTAVPFGEDLRSEVDSVSQVAPEVPIAVPPGAAGVPLIVRHDGRALYGLVSVDELTAFLR